MKKGLFFSFCLALSLLFLSLSLSSCFLKGHAPQKILLFLHSTPYDGISVKVNGAPYETNTQCAVQANNPVILQVDQSKAFDLSGRVGGDDTRLIFERWSSGETDPIIGLIPQKNATYTAHFGVEYYVSFESSATSARQASDPSGWYSSGTQLQLEAPSIAGKDFLRWTVNGENAGNAKTLSLLVDSPKAVVAVYEMMKQPPSSFTALSPTNGATQVNHEPYIQFLWNASVDPQDSSVYYNLYLGESAQTMEIVATGIAGTFYHHYRCVSSKTYYWKVEAVNAYGLKTSTGVMRFSTGAFPPSVPQPVFPRDGAVDVPYSFTLEWECTGGVHYDLYYWITESASTLVQNIRETRYTLNYLEQGVTYHWKVIAYNALGSARSSVWQFTVTESAIPPSNAHSPSPRNSAIDQELTVTLSWGQPVVGAKPFTYDVYFGPAPTYDIEPRAMRRVLSDSPNTSVTVEGLDPGTHYIWQVISKNPWGVSASVIWTFMTQIGVPKPSEPSNPTPATGATEVSTNVTMSWNPSVNGAITYDLYLGTATNTLDKVCSSLSNPSYQPANLALDTTYFWKVIARNQSGFQESEVWSFTTATERAGVSLEKVNETTFLLRANRYFPLESAVRFALDGPYEGCTALTISPIQSSSGCLGEGKIFNFADARSSFSHFSPSNLSIATVTCNAPGTHELVYFYNGSDAIPILNATVSLP